MVTDPTYFAQPPAWRVTLPSLPPQPVSADYTTLTEFQIAMSAWQNVCKAVLSSATPPEGPTPTGADNGRV